jgi:hypothetical protein
MTTITLEVPDDLAAQLKVDPAHLSVLIQEALKSGLGNWLQTPSNSGATQPIIFRTPKKTASSLGIPRG